MMSTDARFPLVPMWLLLACSLISTGAASAQAPAPARPSPAAARAALEAGRASQAVELADAVLAARPADAEALAVKVDALLSLESREKALDAYDAWFKAARVEELPVAGRIARAELEALGKENLAAIATDAVAALAANGSAAARTRLEQAAWATPPTTKSWPAVVALARIGEARAIERVLRAARESTGSGKVEALHAIGRAKTPGAEAIVRDALGTRDAVLQSTAADTAAALGLKTLTPDLQKVAQSGEQFARFSAAAALAELGAPGGDALIEAGASSQAEDVRLLAAAARRARGIKTWAEPVRPLLESPDGLIRFRAAELLLDVDRPAASKVLTAGTTDPNVAIRGEVARIMAADPQTAVSELRRILRDGAPLVRLQAAHALLERAGTGGRRGPSKK
jgi:hypothetical protein